MHYFLSGLSNTWQLLRETSTSQVFDVQIKNNDEFVNASVSIHYTLGNIVHSLICIEGELNDSNFKGSLIPDIEHIVLRYNNNYKTIDFTWCKTEKIHDTHFSIYPETIKLYTET